MQDLPGQIIIMSRQGKFFVYDQGASNAARPTVRRSRGFLAPRHFRDPDQRR